MKDYKFVRKFSIRILRESLKETRICDSQYPRGKCLAPAGRSQNSLQEALLLSSGEFEDIGHTAMKHPVVPAPLVTGDEIPTPANDWLTLYGPATGPKGWIIQTEWGQAMTDTVSRNTVQYSTYTHRPALVGNAVAQARSCG